MKSYLRHRRLTALALAVAGEAIAVSLAPEVAAAPTLGAFFAAALVLRGEEPELPTAHVVGPREQTERGQRPRS